MPASTAWPRKGGQAGLAVAETMYLQWIRVSTLDVFLQSIAALRESEPPPASVRGGAQAGWARQWGLLLVAEEVAQSRLPGRTCFPG